MAVAKTAEAFRTISEAAGELDVPQHVLRHWEEVFGQIRPMRRAGGRRYYRPLDIDILRGVRALLYDERYTTKGVQRIFRENGVKYIAEIGRLSAAGQPIELRPLLDEDEEDREKKPASDAGEPSGLAARLTEIAAKLERTQQGLRDALTALEAIETGGR